MTPLEISEYRSRWMAKGDYAETRVDSWGFEENSRWCRENLKPGTWKGVKYATPDDFSTFMFESEDDMERFKART